MTIQEILIEVIKDNTTYDFGKITIKSSIVSGAKVGYAGGTKKGSEVVSGYITIDSRFIDYCQTNFYEYELINTIKHELAHLIAETFNKKKKTGVWHGQAWKDVFLSLGGNGDRYYTGKFVNVGKTFKTKQELYSTLPKSPATDWDQGTFRQWLERGYHVKKGEKGQFKMWEFSANEYETGVDGKTSEWGRAYAVYFGPEQVEPNTAKEVK